MVKPVTQQQQRKDYDLPIMRDSLSQFQFTLTLIMSILCCWMLSGYFLISDMGQSWTETLHGKATIEIPRLNKDDQEKSEDDIQEEQDALSSYLKKSSLVLEFEVVKDQDIQELVEPWLGDLAKTGAVPYPKLITLTLRQVDEASINRLTSDLEAIVSGVKVNSYGDWFQDLFALISTGKWLSLGIFGILSGIIFMAISFAVAARMAMLDDNIQILHLMGAPAEYIARQFQRQSFIVGLKSSIAGLIIGIASAMIIIHLLLPQAFDGQAISLIKTENAILYVLLPIVITAASALTARLTARKIMLEMP